MDHTNNAAGSVTVALLLGLDLSASTIDGVEIEVGPNVSNYNRALLRVAGIVGECLAENPRVSPRKIVADWRDGKLEPVEWETGTEADELPADWESRAVMIRYALARIQPASGLFNRVRRELRDIGYMETACEGEIKRVYNISRKY